MKYCAVDQSRMMDSDLRHETRYWLRPPVAAHFCETEVRVLDLSGIGARISTPPHAQVSACERITFQTVDGPITFEARVVWTQRYVDDESEQIGISFAPDTAIGRFIQSLVTNRRAVPVEERRGDDRFNLKSRLAAVFTVAGDTELAGISVGGARLTHTTPLRPGTSGTLRLRTPLALPAVSVTASVGWCHVKRNSESATGVLYDAGLVIAARTQELPLLIRRLISAGLAHLDIHSLEVKYKLQRERELERQRSSPMFLKFDERHEFLIEHAIQQLRDHPDLAKSWYARAKFSLSEETVRAAVSSHAHRDGVVAVWEYLDRSVPLADVLRCYSGRAARAS
ncbi:MAG TPA: PilZ domain-containing protein [Thermoanaerobaculia bacterium]|nr:PilZ domain-containing protein [Thermoanaerobaculia bacterium]